ncbi:MAG TPA: beta-ketoacyl-ACP synthase II [Bacteroidales bacterium]|nr:beta-ketoacyl-ACP synthase II [Bacteroidales bacterium]HOE05277.1 beta-ketoacyl-ACP synthase II [Bacteroidales bacterium]
MEVKRVVVTGLGAVSPLGNTVSETWENLKQGVSGANLITHFDVTNFKTKFACEVKNFDPANYFDRKEIKKYDPFTQYALVSAAEAMEDSGLDVESIDKTRAGVIWASGIGGVEVLMQEMKNYFEGNKIPRFNPFFIPKLIIDIAAGFISIKYGFMGPNYSTVSACASSSNAVINACNLIRLGYADVIISGGSEAAVNEIGIGGFNALQAISTRNDDYLTASRPFCATRDGFVLGEGGAALILEEYEHAVKRGAKIYAEIAGIGLSADAYHITAPHPEGNGAALVMSNALKDAHVAPEVVDYINVHGTATPLGDIAELTAIKRVFGDHAFKLNISSSKSMTGHLLGAAGALEALITIKAMENSIVPPTINHHEKDENIDERFNLTFHKAVERPINYGLSNTFGFGGHNTSIIFKKS